MPVVKLRVLRSVEKPLTRHPEESISKHSAHSVCCPYVIP
jgi:hypothetical protein